MASTFGLSLLSVGAEILIRALGRPDELGWDIRCCFTQAVGIYFVVALGCNVVGTALAWYELQSRFPEYMSELGPLDYFLAAFSGTFILGVVLTNTNISLFSRGALTLQDWVSKTRDPAVVSAINKRAYRKRLLQDALKENIQALPRDELRADLLKHLGSEELQRLEKDALENGIEDTELYKVMRLVEVKPVEAKVLSKRVKRRSRKK